MGLQQARENKIVESKEGGEVQKQKSWRADRVGEPTVPTEFNVTRFEE